MYFFLKNQQNKRLFKIRDRGLNLRTLTRRRAINKTNKTTTRQQNINKTNKTDQNTRQKNINKTNKTHQNPQDKQDRKN